MLALCGLLAQSAYAFLHDLSSEQVREAYFLGRNPEKRQSLFNKYIHYPTLPERGPDIHLIEFRTPYEQVALRAQERWFNYSVLDAEQDFAGQPEEVVVRALICSTPTFSFPSPPVPPDLGRPEDYLQGFEFRVSQTHPIEPERLVLRHALLGCGNGSSGFEAFLHFGTEQFAPGQAKVRVTTPASQDVLTEFDLDQLK